MVRAILAILVIVFLQSCEEEPVDIVTYPPTGFYGDNILYPGKADYKFRENSLKANVPIGKSVVIRITGKTVKGGKQPDGSSLPITGVWSFEAASADNWTIGSMDQTDFTQTFTSIDGGQACELKIFVDKGTFLIEYFEHDLSKPNHAKTVTVNY